MSKVLNLVDPTDCVHKNVESLLDNTFLITFIATLVGECISTTEDAVLFSYKDNEYGIIIEKDFVGVADDGSILPASIMYSVIGYCRFHDLPYKHV